jgi:PLP dependent protein
MDKQGKQIACLIQVNIGEEPQKAGVLPSELAGLLTHCRAIGLPIGGLMCIPPATKNAAPYFALMQQLAIRHGLKELSMGMSEDYLTAIRFGATMVRVGTALFGERRA